MDEYKTAVTETQVAFGLADEYSIQLAEGVMSLTERFGEGQVKASEFDDELMEMVRLAEESRRNVADLGSEIAALPDSKTIDIYVNTHTSGGGSGGSSTWGLETA